MLEPGGKAGKAWTSINSPREYDKQHLMGEAKGGKKAKPGYQKGAKRDAE